MIAHLYYFLKYAMTNPTLFLQSVTYDYSYKQHLLEHKLTFMNMLMKKGAYGS